MVRLVILAALSLEDRAAVEATAGRFVTLTAVVAWGFTQRPIRTIERAIFIEGGEIVVLELGRDIYAALEVSSDGRVDRIFVWDHAPTAQEISDSRAALAA